MSNENRTRQFHAVTKDNQLIHIKEAHERGEACYCPFCHCKMIKRCGNVRVWHFAHDPNDEASKTCCYESYLHEYAKLRLKQWFEESPSITVYYQQPVVCDLSEKCKWKTSEDNCSTTKESSFDIKRSLTACHVEKTIHTNDDTFRADLYWFKPDNSDIGVSVEIKVTHECTEKKKQSGERIIEFKIQSEEDVERIVNSNEIRESETVKFYGFKPKAIKGDNVRAQHYLYRFSYFSSGKSFLGNCNCKNYTKPSKTALLVVTFDINNYYAIHHPLGSKLFDVKPNLLYQWGLSLAKMNGYNVRNCLMCKHHLYHFEEKCHSCDLNPDETCELYDALKCNNFIEDDELYQQCINDINEFSKCNNVIDVRKKQQG